MAPIVSGAQRRTVDQWNSWYAISGDIGLSERWSLVLDATIRRSGPVDEAQATMARGGLSYDLAANASVALGVSWSRNYPYGALPIAYTTDERRVWEQLVLSHSLGRLDVSHRYRLEQRFRGRRSDPDVDHIDRWERSSRFRYRIRGRYPIVGKGKAPGEAYLSATNEVFISWGRNVKMNIFNQNRAALAVGYHLSPNWRAELGFLEQLAFKSNGLDVERNHTLTLSLAWNRPWEK